MSSFSFEIQLRSQSLSCPRHMPLSAVTPSTKTALDPFVCFIYPDGSQRLTWDSIYPFLPLLIDPLFFFNGSAVPWKNEFETIYYTEANGKWCRVMCNNIYVSVTPIFNSKIDLTLHKIKLLFYSRKDNNAAYAIILYIICVYNRKINWSFD